jgi:predicted dehydrogenase
MRTSVLVAGLGQIGMGYDLELDAAKYVYSHARAFSQHPEFELVAGVDPRAEQRRTFEAIYARRAYESMHIALREHQPDLVVIATPTATHAATLRDLLQGSRPRTVLCEKPLSYDVREASDMLDACAHHGVRLYVNYMRRSEPGAVEIRRRIESGELGRVFKGVVWYSKGFIHSGSHFFDLLDYWLGPAKSSSVINSGRAVGAHDSEPDVHVVFENGNTVFLAAWEESYSHYSIELLSESGRLRYENEGRSIAWQRSRPDPQFQGYTILCDEPEVIHSGFDRYQWHVADELARALRGEEARLCSGADAYRTLESMRRILG